MCLRVFCSNQPIDTDQPISSVQPNQVQLPDVEGYHVVFCSAGCGEVGMQSWAVTDQLHPCSTTNQNEEDSACVKGFRL